MVDITVSILAPIEIYAQLYVAKATGAFADEDLRVELVTMSSVDAIQHLSAGRIDIGAFSWSPGVLNAISSGLRVAAIGNVFESLPAGTGIYVKPSLAAGSPRNLRGRAIATAGGWTSGGGTLTWARWFASAGLRLGDVSVLDVRSDQAIGALESGAADAAFLNSPFFERAERNATGVRVPVQLPRLATGYFANRQGSGVIVAAFLRALVRTTRSHLMPGWHDDPETVRIVAEAMGQDPRLLLRAGETAFDPTMSMTPWRAELERVQRIWFEHGGVLSYLTPISIEQAVDPSPLHRVLSAT